MCQHVSMSTHFINYKWYTGNKVELREICEIWNCYRQYVQLNIGHYIVVQCEIKYYIMRKCVISTYLFEISKKYNRMYKNVRHSVISDENGKNIENEKSNII